jgi:phosphatidylethanolamine-binding protein (PEBP) family uncharacterized protein
MRRRSRSGRKPASGVPGFPVFGRKGGTGCPMPERLSAVATTLVPVLFCGRSPHAQAARFAGDVTWDGTKSCFDPQSPPFTMSGVPAGTKQLRFAMKDLDAPNFAHGDGTVTYNAQPQIARGAFSYRGPCPPQGRHRYQWTVEALDAAGKTLSTATITKKFPPQ